MNNKTDLRDQMTEHISQLRIFGHEGLSTDVDMGIIKERTAEGEQYGIYDFTHDEMVFPISVDNLFQVTLSLFGAVQKGKTALILVTTTTDGGMKGKKGQYSAKQITPFIWDRISMEKHIVLLDRRKQDNYIQKFYCASRDYLSRDYKLVRVLTEELLAADPSDDETEIITSEGWILRNGLFLVPTTTDLIPGNDPNYPLLFDLVSGRFLWPVFGEKNMILSYIFSDERPKCAPEIMVKCCLSRADIAKG